MAPSFLLITTFVVTTHVVALSLPLQEEPSRPIMKRSIVGKTEGAPREEIPYRNSLFMVRDIALSEILPADSESEEVTTQIDFFNECRPKRHLVYLRPIPGLKLFPPITHLQRCHSGKPEKQCNPRNTATKWIKFKNSSSSRSSPYVKVEFQEHLSCSERRNQ